jgi:hypothetical protein
MAPLSNHVSLSISVDSVGAARAGFGMPMILSHNASAFGADRIRFYSSAGEVDTDFPDDSPEYLAAAAIFAQPVHPDQIAIGRAALPPTLVYTVSVVAAANSTEYAFNVVGEGVTDTEASYTSDSAATVAEIHNGMVTALNAVVGNNYIAAFAPLVISDDTFTVDNTTDIVTAAAHGLQTGDGPVQLTNSGGALPAGLSTVTDYWIIRIDANTFYFASSLANALAGTFVLMSGDGTGTHTLSDTVSTVRPADPFTVTADAAGDWFSLEAVDPALFNVAMTHADPGVATDLAAIKLVNDTWYCLLTLYNSEAYVKAAAAWVESNNKIYLADTNESEAILDASDGTQGLLDDLKTLGYARTMGCWHPAPNQFFAAAWAGAVLPIDPGSETWKFKNLTGIATTNLTSTHRTNLVTRRANSVETVAGVKITFEGTVFNTSIGFMDVQRGIDWLQNDMTVGVFEALAGASKIPYTDAGAAVVEAEVRASLKRAVTRQILSDDPAPEVSVPRVADVASADKTARNLPSVRFNGTLAGAIHKGTITGTVTV